MPHIILEYAACLADDSRVNAMLEVIHRAVSSSGLFEPSHIKTRAYPFQQFTHADGAGPYMHVQARIKSGRRPDDKQQLAESILAGLVDLGVPSSVITVEIIDMDRAAYAKWKSP